MTTTPISPYSTASSMLLSDKGALLMYGLILILPELTLTTFPSLERHVVFLEFIGRIIQLLLTYLVGMRWLKTLCGEDFSPGGLPSLLFFGMCYWALLALPVSLLFLLPKDLGLLVIFLLVPITIFALRYYFYFLPVLCGTTKITQVLVQSSDITKEQTNLALRAIAAPFGLMLVATSLTLTLSPDGRDVVVLYLTDIASGIFPLLAIYLSLAFALTSAPESFWDSQEISYEEVQSKLIALSLHEPAFITSALTAKRGIIIILVGFLIALGNDMRAQSLPPEAVIQLENVRVLDESIIVVLHTHDETHHYRSFRPAFFRLAGTSGTSLNEQLPTVLVDGKQLDSYEQLKVGDYHATIELEFKTDRDDDELKKLREIYLWYRNALIVEVPVGSHE